MKKILTILIFLAVTHIFAELPKGDVSLITATEKGLLSIEIKQAKIEEENGKRFINLPRLGRSELISNKEGNKFYALYHPKMVPHNGKEYEEFSVTIFTVSMHENGDIYCLLSRVWPDAEPWYERYLLKSGKLK